MNKKYDNITLQQKETLFKLEVEGKSILGVLHQPLKAKSNNIVIFCGGLNAQRCDVNRLAVKFSRLMAEKGISVVRFDYRGLGISEGSTLDMTIYTKIKDIEAIINYVINTYHYKEVFLLGFSDGARNITHLSSNNPSIKGVIMWNPTLIYNKVEGNNNKPILDKKTNKILWVMNGNFLTSEFYRSVQNVEDTITKKWTEYDKSTLIIWGGNDITTATTKKIMDTTKSKAEINELTIPGARHLFSRGKDHEILITYTYNWLKEFI